MTVSSVSGGLSSVQVLAEVQPKRLEPATALLLKNIYPVVQFTGRDAPTVIGFVEAAAEKSTFFDCVFRSIKVVWATAAADMVNSITGNFTFVCSTFHLDGINRKT